MKAATHMSSLQKKHGKPAAKAVKPAAETKAATAEVKAEATAEEEIDNYL